MLAKGPLAKKPDDFIDVDFDAHHRLLYEVDATIPMGGRTLADYEHLRQWHEMGLKRTVCYRNNSDNPHTMGYMAEAQMAHLDSLPKGICDENSEFLACEIGCVLRYARMIAEFFEDGVMVDSTRAL